MNERAPVGGPARQERLRALNLQLVFAQVLDAAAPISRTELAAATGLTRPTITRIVDELIAGSLIAETGAAPDGRAGRPRVGLKPARRGPAGLGLDLRADGLAACVVDLSGAVRHLAFAPFDYADADAVAVLERLGRMAADAVEAVDGDGLTVAAVTLAAPGPVSGGLVRSAPALGWRDVDAGALLAAELGGLGPVTAVDNEANLAAHGELHAADHGNGNFVYVSGGLDIGVGIVLDGRLMTGSRGELGHVTVDPDGKPCPCGSRGCLQTYASLHAIVGGEPLPAGTGPGTALADWADQERATTLAAIETAGNALGVALSNLLNLLEVDTVLLGGSFAILSSWMLDHVEAQIRQRVLSAQWSPVSVRPGVLGPDAAAIGAAMTFVDRLRRDPGLWLAAG